jgi:hypothetical protein
LKSEIFCILLKAIQPDAKKTKALPGKCAAKKQRPAGG